MDDLETTKEDFSEQKKFSDVDILSNTPKSRRYINHGGNFITGIDVTSQEAAERRAKRMERFGNLPLPTSSENMFSLDKIEERAKRFGVQAPIVNGEVIKCVKKLPAIPQNGDQREEAVYIHGTNEMSTNDVLGYFSEYGPKFLEWIDDTSCNAVWEDPTSAHRALYGKGEYPVIAEKDKDKIQEELFTPVWRLGVPHPRSKQLLLRVATTLDTKNRGAANRSQYYRKYGNPNSSDWPTEHETFQEDLRQRLSHKRVLETPETSTGEDDDDKNWNEDMETEDLDVKIPSLVTRPKKMKSMYSEDTSREDEDLGKMRSNREEEGTKDLRMKLTTSNNKKGLKSRLGQMKT